MKIPATLSLIHISLAELIAQQRERSFHTYGYRRMWLWLKSQSIYRDPKTVLRIMKQYDLLSEIRRPRKWRQMGQQLHKYENLLNREFHTDKPNSKWVTDISYILSLIHISFPAEKSGVNATIVGKPAAWIAEQAGIKVPANTKILIARIPDCLLYTSRCV